MALTRKHKEYVLDYINQIDPHTINVERAFGNFLWLLKNKGRPVKATRRTFMLVRELAEKVVKDTKHFQGLDAGSEEILGKWLASDFADIVQSRIKESSEFSGEAMLAGLLPLHLDVVKLRNPYYAKDYGTSRFIYNIALNSQPLLEELRSFFDVNIHETQKGHEIDIETLFLVHLLSNFWDDPSSTVPEKYYPPLCKGEAALFVDDLMRVILYRNHIPRREIIRYLITITSFHLALSTFRTVKVVNGACESGQSCMNCMPDPSKLDPTPGCPFRPDIFVDLTEQKDHGYELARRKVQKHYGEVSKYIKNSIRLKKLDEFAQARLTPEEWKNNISGLLALEKHQRASSYFDSRIDDLIEPEGEEEVNTDLDRVRKLGLSPLDTYVEMLYSLIHKNTIPRYRRMLDNFCGKNLDTGFLRAGKGKTGRRYFLGSELLETLVQISVVDYKNESKRQRGMTITDFVEWLKNRYGILIDEYGEPVDNAEIAQAMSKNYNALKDRLRQLGFYAALSDASNSQEIQPRYKIV